MSAALLALLSSPVLGDTIVLEVGEPVDTEIGGTWTRAFANGDGGWWFVFGAGGTMNVVTMGDDLVAQDRGRIRLEGDQLADTEMAACADGTFLMGGSGSLEAPDDAGYAWRYDASWPTLGGGLIDWDSDAMHNDMAVLCSAELTGLSFMGVSEQAPFVVSVDDSAQAVDRFTLPQTVPLIGGSMVIDPWSEELLTLGAEGPDPDALSVHRFSLEDPTAPSLVERCQAPVEGIGRIWWPQAMRRIGDSWIVAVVGEQTREEFPDDVGNIHLAIFEHDWVPREVIQVTDFGILLPLLSRRRRSA